jgi:hypothetical protein
MVRIVKETYLIRNVVVKMPCVGWISQVRLVGRLLHMDIWETEMSEYGTHARKNVARRRTVPIDVTEPRMRLDIGRPVIAQPISWAIAPTDTLGPWIAPLRGHDRIWSVCRSGCHASQPVFWLAEKLCKKVGTISAQTRFGRKSKRFSPAQAVNNS